MDKKFYLKSYSSDATNNGNADYGITVGNASGYTMVYPHIIDESKCIKCGKCENVCRFAAIDHANDQDQPRIYNDNCVGCDKCINICPTHAISTNTSTSPKRCPSSRISIYTTHVYPHTINYQTNEVIMHGPGDMYNSPVNYNSMRQVMNYNKLQDTYDNIYDSNKHYNKDVFSYMRSNMANNII